MTGALRELDALRDRLIGLDRQDPALEVRSGGGQTAFVRTDRLFGRDWPAHAESMIGARRMRQLQEAVVNVVADRVPGDLLEAGVWRGGACILMRAVLKALGVTDRRVWVADSFRGLPPPDPERYPTDRGDLLYTFEQLAVPLEEVRGNFARYGLLDAQVVFLEGWFKDTLKDAPIGRLAVLRCDGDLYESTMDTLAALYPKVSPGGYVIVDDYGMIPTCAAAVNDYRRTHGIADPIHRIDSFGAYWRKAR